MELLLESDPEGALTIDLGKVERPSEFVLNYEIIKHDGCVRAEVHARGGVKAHTFEDCVPMTRGSTGETATWKTGSVIPVTPAARVCLQLENARVYAYEVRDVE